MTSHPPAKPRRKPGRPRVIDRTAKMKAVCERISTGELVKDAAKVIGVTQADIWRWGATPEFAEMYTRARTEQAHAIAEDALTVAEDATAENAQAIRVRVDTRKWLASKIAPRHYGERLDVTSGDKPLPATQTIIIGGQEVKF